MCLEKAGHKRVWEEQLQTIIWRLILKLSMSEKVKKGSRRFLSIQKANGGVAAYSLATNRVWGL